jgi:hypothetical protein
MGAFRDVTTPREGSRELPTDPAWAMTVDVLQRLFFLKWSIGP